MGFLDKALKTASDLTNQAGAKLADQAAAAPEPEPTDTEQPPPPPPPVG